MSNLTDFEKILTEINLFIQDLTAVEKEKFDAAVKNNILVLEDCISKEQALLLRSRGLEQKRLNAQKSMNMDGLSLKQMIDSSSEEDKKRLTPLYHEINKNLTEYKDVYSNAKNAIEVNLHRINTHLESLTGKPFQNSVAYTDHGQKINKPRSFTSRRA